MIDDLDKFSSSIQQQSLHLSDERKKNLISFTNKKVKNIKLNKSSVEIWQS